MLYLKLETGDWCHVHILDFYLSELPTQAFQRDIFFSQLPKLSLFSLGILLLQLVKIHWQNGKRCADGAIVGTKSNHGLCVTGATELYQTGVSEKVIQERTGHLSLTGLRQYERTSGKQHETVSEILAVKGRVTNLQQFSVQSNSIVSPIPQPHYSFSNGNVTFNSFPPGYQSPALSDVTHSVVNHETH